VVVAAGAGDRQPEEHGPGRVGHLGQRFVPAERQFLVASVPPDRAEAVEPGRDAPVRAVRVELVAGQLFDDEPVERLVGVEGGDHVVAVPPGAGPVAVVLETFGLGVPNHVEPVPAPLLPVGRRGEQAVYEPLVRVRGGIIDEGVNLGGRRGQAGQVECHPADERDAVGLRTRRQPFPV
jgi:hypothetical protein